jgi:hypothetical protein
MTWSGCRSDLLAVNSVIDTSFGVLVEFAPQGHVLARYRDDATVSETDAHSRPKRIKAIGGRFSPGLEK